MRPLNDKIFAYVLAALLALSGPYAHATATHNPQRYAKILNQLKSIQAQIRQYSDMVGVVREQINTMNKVAAGIRDLENVVNESVQGIAGELASQLGLKDVFAVLGETQGLYDDAAGLIREARQLPDQAKQRIREIGMSVDDVSTYLREGLAYETLYKLGVDDWKKVIDDPWNALETGAFGAAIQRSEGYLSEEARGAAWKHYMEGLSPEDRERAGAVLGAEYATFLGAQWLDGMKLRAKNSADFRDVGNKLSEVVGVEPKKAKQGGSGTDDDKIEAGIVEEMTTATAIKNWDTKITAEGAIRDGEASFAVGAAEQQRLNALKATQSDQVTDDTIQALKSP